MSTSIFPQYFIAFSWINSGTLKEKNMDEKYRTGHPEIDKQHEILFEIIDDVKAHSNQPIVMQLIQYVVQHFSYEEALMKQNHYPNYEVHKQKHEEIKKIVRSCKDQLLKGGQYAEDLNKVLELWVQYHVGDYDKKLASFLLSL